MKSETVKSDGARVRSVLSVSKMDCPSEENLVRMALGKRDDITALTFDLGARTVTIDHTGDGNDLMNALAPLGLGAQLRESRALPAEATGSSALVETVISVPKMDCPSEENMIRMALANTAGIQALTFDLAARTLHVVHQGDVDPIAKQLTPLGLGARVVSSTPTHGSSLPQPDAAGDAAEARTLRLLLGINGLMFLVEMVWGVIAQSTGLIADSLDMFADAAVYGLALYAVGRAASLKTRAAHMAGWLQLALALGALGEVVRRAFTGSEPESAMMMGVGALALVANVACLVLIAKKRDRGAHMKASYIFSANDVIANLGVIVAGALVTWTGSSYPDLIIGTIIAVIVLLGARRILALR